MIRALRTAMFRRCPSGLQVEKLGHFLVQKALSGAVRLNPLPIDDKLWNRPLTNVANHFVGRLRVGLDIDLSVGNAVLFQKSLSLAAIAAPRSGVDQNVHSPILSTEGETGGAKAPPIIPKVGKETVPEGRDNQEPGTEPGSPAARGPHQFH
jgi:hypothetical protein